MNTSMKTLIKTLEEVLFEKHEFYDDYKSYGWMMWCKFGWSMCELFKKCFYGNVGSEH